jgi:glycosyltransferase involved in cell wall biosynthesis
LKQLLDRTAWRSLSRELLPRFLKASQVRRIRASSLFDPQWYLASYPDVKKSGIEPAWHYLRYGADEMRNPGPGFSTTTYRKAHPELPLIANPLLDALAHQRTMDARSLPPLERARPDTRTISALIFEPVDLPRASIIVDGSEGSAGSDTALPALAALQARLRLDVIILTPPNSNSVPHGTRPVPAEQNRPGVSWNRAIAAARAPVIVFLNGGLEPAADAIEVLLETLSQRPHADLVCASCQTSDRYVLDAGGICDAENRLLPRGYGYPAEHQEIASFAEVDFATPGLFATTHDLLEALGGFRDGVSTPWSAAAELSFRARAQGKSAFCQPFAVALAPTVVLPSGQGDAPNRGSLCTGESPLRRRRGPEVLFIDHATPTPDRDAGSFYNMSLMRGFIELDYAVTFLPAFVLSYDGHYTDALRRAGISCICSPNENSVETYIDIHVSQFDLIVLSRAYVANSHLDRIRRLVPKTPIIFNTVDLHFLREEREVALGAPAERVFQARRTKEVELSIVSRSDLTVVLSSVEQAILADMVPNAKTVVWPIVQDMPGLEAPLPGRRDIVFIGGFMHRPNVDAVLYFAHHIWPTIRRNLPDAKFIVIGSDPTPEILALGERESAIEIRGFVQDLSAVLRSCRLTVAPIRFGAGIKGKVISSLAAGVPCVATPVAVEGMGLTPGEDIMMASEPACFAAAVVLLYTDDDAWHRISRAGLATALNNFSVAGLMRALRETLKSLPAPIPPPPP